jgi:hypothetical protein
MTSSLVRQSKQCADTPNGSYCENHYKHQVQQVLHCIPFAPGLEHSDESNSE